MHRHLTSSGNPPPFFARRLSLFLFLAACACTARAQLVQLPLEEIVASSELLTEGRVTGKFSFWDKQHQHIYTANEVEVFKIFKGGLPSPAASITVVTLGGVVDLSMELVSESAQYEVGQTGLFCLNPSTLDIPLAGAWENYGSPHGFFAYDKTSGTAANPFHVFHGIETAFYQTLENLTGRKPSVLKNDGLSAKPPPPQEKLVPVITSFSPNPVTAGTNTSLSIVGTGFGAMTGSVRFKNANDGGATYITADASDIVSWTDALIVVKVPSRVAAGGTPAGTGTIEVVTTTPETVTSTEVLTVDYAYTNFSSSGTKYSAKMVADDGAGGLAFTLSTSICGTNQAAVNATGRTLKAWRCADGVNFKLAPTSTTSTAIADDDTNIITFDVTVPLTGGVIGRATSYYSGCSVGMGPLQWSVEEIDVNMDEATTWFYCDDPAGITGSETDFQSVMFHELGHGHQLGHVILSTAVMHYSITAGTVKRTLATGEAAGAAFILGQAANTCGPGSMTSALATCTEITSPATCTGSTSCTAALPVELASFTAKPAPEGVLLEWATASESGSDHFTVERSADGSWFELLAVVPGAGNSSEPRQYGHLDRQPLQGVGYYRLKQTDFDGSFTYSEVVSVEMEGGGGSFAVSPNPVAQGEALRLVFDSPEAGEALVEVFNASGQRVAVESFPLEAGLDFCQMALADIPPGILAARVVRQGTAQAVKFVKN